MRFKRFIAALAALCILAAPAALAATVANTGGAPAEQNEAQAKASAAAARKQALRTLAARRNVRLARQIASRQGDRLDRGYARRAHARKLGELRRSNVRLRRELRSLRRERTWYRLAFRKVPATTLRSIAQCESHGNPRAIGGGGLYRGMFQMTFDIWGAVGGKGDPASASAAEQHYRAALIYTRYGSGQWPVCGR
ncbi:MAG: transglycosylase family protein [Solirubrobacteraceae bacterium]